MGTEVRSVHDTVSDQVPKLRVTTGQVHLHTERDLTFLIAAFFHLHELIKSFLDRSLTVFTRTTFTMSFTTTTGVDLFRCTLTGIG
ncbi:hypothetical protein G6F68_021725 [Rhizopus microsporus]|nr:hypothetical protein G6F68_021725 [Rhizopus microsporus]